MGPLIELIDVHKIYSASAGEVRALDGVSLTIQQGEFVAVVGNSGAGKSTLMNMLGCLDMPDAGRYFLAGKEVSRMCDHELSSIRNQEIGFVFQGFNLISSLNAAENVELPLMYRGIPRERRSRLALEALQRVGLADRTSHLPGEMSGGQQQRVAIARAVAAMPPIILADEPTGNLDSHSGGEVMGILQELWRGGKTVILITHSSKVASKAGRMVRIHDGKVVEDHVIARK